MRLIDADELMEDFPIRIHRYDKEHGDLSFVLGIESVMEYINDNMPTVDTVKHGKWNESKCFDTCFWVCSNCKFPSEAIAAPKLYRYCPNCGAKMDGDKE